MKTVSIANTKGGVGKTTINILLANYLHNMGDFNVRLFDMDEDQNSSYNARVQDLSDIEILKEYRPKANILKRYAEFIAKKEPFEISIINSDNFHRQYEKAIEENVDFLFIDPPGSFNKEVYSSILPYIDLVLVPLFSDALTCNATIQFLNRIQGLKSEINLGFKISSFFNRVKKVRLNTSIEAARVNLKSLVNDLEIMGSVMYDNAEIEDTIFSTLIPLDKSNKEAHFFDQFIAEFLNHL